MDQCYEYGFNAKHISEYENGRSNSTDDKNTHSLLMLLFH